MRPHLPIALAFALLPATGCKPVDDRKEITVTREPSELAPKAQLGLSLPERMGRTTPAAEQEPAGPPFAWEKPESWLEVPGSAMRVANFKFGPGGVGECYFTVLPGGGGGLLPNLNRWRKQFGLAQIDQAEADTLPDRKLLFGSGKLIDLQGNFTPMGAAAPQEGYRLLGVIMPQVELGDMQVAFFVKMTGPADLVEAEQERFDTFCASLRMAR